jgi:uncharacterized protein YdhG (YjbR/CyaY superfamily)
MQSKATDVGTYIAEAPADRQAVLRKLRRLCRKTLAGYEEGMEYGMPSYKRDGKLQVSFASQKQYISLYALKEDVVNEFRAALKGCNIGKGCIRFSNPERIDFEVVEKLLWRTAESASKAC